jgi:hypothetical protein
MKMKKWLPALPVVLVTMTMYYVIAARGQGTTIPSLREIAADQLPERSAAPQIKPKTNKTVVRSRNPNDYLWLLEVEDEANLSTEFRNKLRILSASKVPTVSQAKKVAFSYKFKSLGGVAAEEAFDVVGLVQIGIDVKDFVKRGDLIWDVRVSHLFYGVTQEMWISSTTGAVKCIFAAQKKEPSS